ncbi:MAG: hypothetical protein ABIS36_10745 [Chryseolinea sp.]
MFNILLEIVFAFLFYRGKPKMRLSVVVAIGAFFLGVVVFSVVRHTTIG